MNTTNSSRQNFKPLNPKSGQLFSSHILEKISKTHIAVPISIFVTYAFSILYWSISHTTLSTFVTVIFFMTGLIAFTWVEYNVHRYVFHSSTPTRLRKKIQYVIHGVHHEFPRDKDRLAMPPLISLTVATVILLLFRLIMGDLAFAFMPGFMVGYACYLSVHYIIHVYPPPKGLFRTLWWNHSIHHYKDCGTFFGVSSPLWDYIYRTIPLKEMQKSPSGKKEL